ncbi:MAG: hypothetical protein WC099_00785 [Candidatus Paceibacterota bacterium]
MINTYAQDSKNIQPYSKVGNDPQDPTFTFTGFGPGMVLFKTRTDVWVRTNSGSGKKITILMNRGAVLSVPREVFLSGHIKEFLIVNCKNETIPIKNAKGKSLTELDLSETTLIVDYDAFVEKIRTENQSASSDSVLFLIQKGLQSISISIGSDMDRRLDIIGGELHNIRMTLEEWLESQKEGKKEDEEKIESSSDWWKWALGAVGVITLGVITYKLLQQKDNGTTIIVNPPITPPTGGPANPNNSMAPGGGFGLSFGVRF